MAAATATLPRIAPPPPHRKVDWRRARAALSQLIADPGRTEQVFELIDALAGNAGERLFQRFLRHPDAPELLARKPALLPVLSNLSQLESLPEGSLGRIYARFMREGGIVADGLQEASAEVRREREEIDAERRWFYDRLRDQHDLWHALTGYGRDVVGEVALLSFTYAQTRNRGILAIVLTAIARGPKSRDLYWPRYLGRAWRRGRRASMLPAAKWEELLPLPLAEARRRLRVSEPEVAHPGGILVAGDSLNAAAA